MAELRRPHLRETVKLGIRRSFALAGLDVRRDPFFVRLQRMLTSRDINTVVDVGANVGQYASLLRAGGFKGRIVSVEPMLAAYRELEQRARRDPQWLTVNAGVGAAAGEGSLNISGNSYSSSVLDMLPTHLTADPESRYIGSEQFRMTTVTDLMHDFALEPRRTLLKVDTQGYEREVLNGAEKPLESLAALQLELSFVPLYAGQATFDTLTTRVQALGYRLWAVESGFSDAAGRMLQCDAVFMREPLDS